MTQPVLTAEEAILQRRRFLRGGALAAAAAGGAVAAAATTALPASASDAVYAISLAVEPTRILDTRTSEGRTAIARTSTDALTSKGRLRKGGWIDVKIAETDEVLLIGVFLNLTSLSSLKSGSLVVTGPSDEPPTGTTLTHAKGETVSNSAFVPVGTNDGFSLVRVFASATGHVLIDLTGGSVVNLSGLPLRSSFGSQAERLAKAFRAVRR